MVNKMANKNKLVQGVGINDADYDVRSRAAGSHGFCPIYQRWASILERCYNKACQVKNPTYADCSVCDEWLTFSNFKAWMEKNDWKGKDIDKDILFKGNKVYSPNTCVFISTVLNRFTCDVKASRGAYPIGVDMHKQSGRLRARCCNPFTSSCEHLGLFDCEQKAHEAWRKRKHELACQLADIQTDERVAAALRLRYAANQAV